MSLMTSQILEFNYFTKTKSRYLENKTLLFLQIKNSLIAHQWLLFGKKYCKYYFDGCLSDWLKWPHMLILKGFLLVILIDFSVTIPRCYDDVYVISFFPGTTRLWNSLPVKCFCLIYDLNGFKSIITDTF